ILIYTLSLHDALPIFGVHLRTDEVCFARFEFERDQPPVYLAELRVPRSAFSTPTIDAGENIGSEVVVPDDVRFFLGEVADAEVRSEEHTSELQSQSKL